MSHDLPEDRVDMRGGHICKGDPISCPLKTCLASSGDHYCGKIGDGCGGTLDCGDFCPAGWTCVDNLCVASRRRAMS